MIRIRKKHILKYNVSADAITKLVYLATTSLKLGKTHKQAHIKPLTKSSFGLLDFQHINGEK